jgi:BirA family biotin operon repressor/biotin-[acetyl-CoA-carboxylase] ligase
MFPAEISHRLVAAELQGELPAIIGREIIVLEQTGSTNDAILEVAWPKGVGVALGRRSLGESGSPSFRKSEGLVLFAEHQSAGRGQWGNRWESAPGKGLWFSILLQPEIEINESARLTLWAIETISDVIRTELSLEPTIKLPNDIQIHRRKVAGVLTEMRAQEKAPHLAVVGIGINVNHSRQDFPPELRNRAISLAMALQRSVDRQKFAVALLRNLDQSYREKFPERL